MDNILLVYSTTDGHTRKISERIKRILEEDAHEVKMISIDDESGIDLTGFDKIVLGASIRYGKHSRQVYDFIKKHQSILDKKPNAFFSVNLVSRKPEKCSPETNPYLKKFLKQIPWAPREIALFAGKLDYGMYGFIDRLMIQLIMMITKGPTDPKTSVEFTDWSKVDAFAMSVGKLRKTQCR